MTVLHFYPRKKIIPPFATFLIVILIGFAFFASCTVDNNTSAPKLNSLELMFEDAGLGLILPPQALILRPAFDPEITEYTASSLSTLRGGKLIPTNVTAANEQQQFNDDTVTVTQGATRAIYSVIVVNNGNDIQSQAYTITVTFTNLIAVGRDISGSITEIPIQQNANYKTTTQAGDSINAPLIPLQRTTSQEEVKLRFATKEFNNITVSYALDNIDSTELSFSDTILTISSNVPDDLPPFLVAITLRNGQKSHTLHYAVSAPKINNVLSGLTLIYNDGPATILTTNTITFNGDVQADTNNNIVTIVSTKTISCTDSPDATNMDARTYPAPVTVTSNMDGTTNVMYSAITIANTEDVYTDQVNTYRDECGEQVATRKKILSSDQGLSPVNLIGESLKKTSGLGFNPALLHYTVTATNETNDSGFFVLSTSTKASAMITSVEIKATENTNGTNIAEVVRAGNDYVFGFDTSTDNLAEPDNLDRQRDHGRHGLTIDGKKLTATNTSDTINGLGNDDDGIDIDGIGTFTIVVSTETTANGDGGKYVIVVDVIPAPRVVVDEFSWSYSEGGAGSITNLKRLEIKNDTNPPPTNLSFIATDPAGRKTLDPVRPYNIGEITLTNTAEGILTIVKPTFLIRSIDGKTFTADKENRFELPAIFIDNPPNETRTPNENLNLNEAQFVFTLDKTNMELTIPKAPATLKLYMGLADIITGVDFNYYLKDDDENPPRAYKAYTANGAIYYLTVNVVAKK